MSTPTIPAERPPSPPWDDDFGLLLICQELPETGLSANTIVTDAILRLIAQAPEHYKTVEAFAHVPELPDGALAMAGHILASLQSKYLHQD